MKNENRLAKETMEKANAARDQIVSIFLDHDLSFLEGLTALGIVMSETLGNMPEEMGRSIFASLSQTILNGAYPDETLQ